MDKKVMFAVAGSGKTTFILNQLNLSVRSIIITYTNSNLKNLNEGILKKFGFYPENIKVFSYYNFLYKFCYRPFLSYSMRARGINWKVNFNRFAKNDDRYIDDFKRLYSNRIAKLLEEKDVLRNINERLTKYFNVLYIDEIQDFAGNDFNFLKALTKADVKILFVGDFYQHTFDTSRDGNVNSSLHDDYEKYKSQFQKMGLLIDPSTLIKSYRCSPTVCEFITEQIGINIESHRTDISIVKMVDNEAEAIELLNNALIVKLFYQEHYKYVCYSKNWGDCKGEDIYFDVCVVLNSKTWGSFQKGTLRELPAQTKNKLYVACSRAKGNLFFVPDTYYKSLKVKPN